MGSSPQHVRRRHHRRAGASAATETIGSDHRDSSKGRRRIRL